MRDVMAYVHRRVEEQHVHPFLEWLRDESVPARDRLSRWLPHNAGFAMGFMDLNTLILRYPDEEAALCRLKRAINHHADQDGTHWEWYLRDLQKLGLNRKMRFTGGLKLLWNDETRAIRRFAYRVCGLANKYRDPVMRFCILMPFEEFAQVLFAQLARVSRRYAAETSVELEYVGEIHSKHEPGDLINQEDEEETRRMFRDVKLNDADRAAAMDISRYLCDEIVTRWMSNLRVATENRIWSMLVLPPASSAERAGT